MPIDLGDGCTLYISGQIDRVDVYKKDGVSYIKIIDYKTGKKVFRLKDIRCGFNLQMLLYLASVLACGKEKYGDKLLFWGGLNSLDWADPKKVEAEVERLVPFMKQQGGYIFGTDHSVPDNVSAAQFKHIMDRVRELGRY
jgi:ATP-dependent helicase/DNAse subunit B